MGALRLTVEEARTRLIGEIYDVALRPQRFDELMRDWDTVLADALVELEELRVTSGEAGRQLDDPGLAEHFERAFEILGRVDRDAPGAQASASRADQGLFLLIDGEGLVRDASKAARDRLPEIENATDLEAHLDAGSVSRLREALSLAARGRADRVLTVLIVPGLSGTAGSLHWLACGERADGAGPDLVRIRPLDISWSVATETVLREAFGLTPGECRTVEQLAAGRTVSAVAAADGRSVHTVRTQLKSVFAKTRTATQTELMRMLSMLSFESTDERPNLELAALIDHGRIERIALRDGRSMAVHTFGPLDGTPVVFIHGMLDGISVNPIVAREIAERGYRFVAPVRASFGRSDPLPDPFEAYDIFVDDALQMIRHLELERPLLLGHMAGSVFAFALAGALGDATRGIVNVSGGVPIVDARQFRAMNVRQRVVAFTARYAPKVLPTILRSGIRQITSGQEERFMHALYPPGSVDRAVSAKPEVRAAIFEGYHFAVSQGERAFQGDAMVVTRDWSRLVVNCPCRTLLVHGAHDPVVSADSVVAFADDHPHVDARIVPDGGQLLFYSQPATVFDALDELADVSRPIPVN